jgi:Lrp/AsnC family leucine-responsive transcriptional regulator
MLDKIDKKILALLQENARHPLKYLASRVFLSSPAVSSRIERLEKKGVITGYHAAINPAYLGYHLKAFISLNLIPKEKEKFYSFIQECPNVVECNCITGKFSILMKVIFPTTDQLDMFINQLEKFGITETQIAFSTPIETRGLRMATPSFLNSTEELEKAAL